MAQLVEALMQQVKEIKIMKAKKEESHKGSYKRVAHGSVRSSKSRD